MGKHIYFEGQIVGYQFEKGELSISVNGETVTFLCRKTDPSLLGIVAGQWVFIGDDNPGSAFKHNVGYARMKHFNSASFDVDGLTWDPHNDSGENLSIKIYFGEFIKSGVK